MLQGEMYLHNLGINTATILILNALLVTICTIIFHFKKFHLLPTEGIYVF